ncbi:hypothetical protein [Haloarchaeobius sp. TZWWS8]|uniref:hypothetical protein n=1 Tax=Haloarchaeobius sp. TZWWS8 TaxID=3446121 RepID=UPI003EB931D8
MVAARPRLTGPLFNREAAVSFALLLSLVAMAELTSVQVLQLPGHLLVVGWNLFEELLPLVEQTAATVAILFVCYLYLLAVGLGWVVRRAGQKA